MKLLNFLPFAALFVLAACDSDGVVRPPPADVRMLHAAPNYNTIGFLREENAEAILDFGQGSAVRFDSGQYDFHMDTVPVGASAVFRALSFSADLSPDLDYTLVLIAPSGPLEVMTVTTPDVDPASGRTRITVVHAHPSLGAVDVHLEIEGTALSSATVRASLGFGPAPTVFEVPSEIYHLFLTTAGDPNDVIYESTDLFIVPNDDFVYVISDPANQGFSPLAVTEVGTNTRRIGDANELSAIRFLQGIDDRLDRDIILENQTVTPFLTNLAFGDLIDYVDITRALHTVGLTPAGNNTVLEDSLIYTAVAGRYSTIIYAGNPSDEVSGLVLLEDKRSITGQATVTIMNVAGLFESLEIFIESPGTDISAETPVVTLAAPGLQDRAAFVPGDYEVTVRDLTSGSIVAGPTPLALADGGVYNLRLQNAATGSSVDTIFIDDSPP